MVLFWFGVRSQKAVVFFWFGFRSQKAVCSVLREVLSKLLMMIMIVIGR